MIDDKNNRICTIKIDGVKPIESKDLTVSDLVTHKLEGEDNDLTIDDLLNRNVGNPTGVTVTDLINRDYNTIVQPSAVYTNVISINVYMKTAIPIIRLDNIDDKSIDENLVLKKVSQPLEQPKNTLYDPDMTDRFKLIATPRSLYTDKLVHVYWDKKYEDIFIIPDISNICNKDSYKTLIGNEIAVEGTAVGSHDNSQVSSEYMGAYLDSVTCKEEPEDLVVESYLRKTAVSVPLYPLDVYNLSVDDIHIGRSKLIKPVQYINLGKREAVFHDKPVPTYHMYSNVVGKEFLLYNGTYNTPEIIIPFQF